MNHFQRFFILIIFFALAGCTPVVPTDTNQTTSTSSPTLPAMTATTAPTATPEVVFPPSPTPEPEWLYQIAFAGNILYIINADGTGLTSFTEWPVDFSAPAWSPDGLSLAVRRDRPTHGISVLHLTTTNGLVALDSVKWVTSGFIDSPTWTPDGQSITFQMADDHWYLYSVPAGGGRYTRLPNLPAEATEPAWSPDGTRLAYILTTNDPYRTLLYVANADGTGQTLISTGELDAGFPDWSPDGKQIAFAGWQSGEEYLYIINADGSGLRQVPNSDSGFDPDWSPDGYRLAFTSDRDDNYDIYVINLDGTGKLRLTNDAGFQRWPVWRRIPMPAVQPWLDCQSQAALLGDVSIPAGTSISSGQEFQKIWRLQNTGSCVLNAGYHLQYLDGERMGSLEQLALPAAIQPGDTLDVALTLTAPTTPSGYAGRWRLVDTQGNDVPDLSGNPLTLSVEITVQPSDTTMLPTPLFFLSERSGSKQVWMLERDGHSLAQITQTDLPVDAYAISAATGMLAYSAGGQLFVADRLIASTDPDHSISNLAWSADGRILAYPLEDGVHLYDMQTGLDRLLIENNPLDISDVLSYRRYAPVSFSPDGSQLAAVVYYWESTGWAIIDTQTSSVYETFAPYSTMTTWSQSGNTFYIANAEEQGMLGFLPSLWRVAYGASGFYTENLIDNLAVWAPWSDGDSVHYLLSGAQGLSLYRSDTNNVSERVVLWQQPYLFGQNEIDSIAWTDDGSYVALSLPHRSTSEVNEVLLFSSQDVPPLYLLQDADELQWGSAGS